MQNLPVEASEIIEIGKEIDENSVVGEPQDLSLSVAPIHDNLGNSQITNVPTNRNRDSALHLNVGVPMSQSDPRTFRPITHAEVESRRRSWQFNKNFKVLIYFKIFYLVQ